VNVNAVVLQNGFEDVGGFGRGQNRVIRRVGTKDGPHQGEHSDENNKQPQMHGSPGNTPPDRWKTKMKNHQDDTLHAARRPGYGVYPYQDAGAKIRGIRFNRLLKSRDR
jgi:hypothetical protein